MPVAALLRTFLPAVLSAGAAVCAVAQTAPGGGYREPPAVIRDILDAPAAPTVLLSPSGRTLLLLGRASMPDIDELAQPELGLAGVRINPLTHGPTRGGTITSLTLHDIETGHERTLTVPGGRIGFIQWSPDGTHVAFGSTVANGIELWVADVRSGGLRRLPGPGVNATLGVPFTWMPDGRALVVKQVIPGRTAPPSRPVAGPVIQQTDERALRVRTLADLLGGPDDERAFEHYFTAQLVRLPIDGGAATPLGEPAIIAAFTVAPGGEYVLVTKVTRPYSHAVGVSGFGRTVAVIDRRGRTVHTVAERSEIELPGADRDAVPGGARNPQWRADAPATLVWLEAIEAGNGSDGVRDRVVQLAAPFTGPPRTLTEVAGRVTSLLWARPDVALVSSWWSGRGRSLLHVIDPSRPDDAAVLLRDRAAEDRYGDPGTPVLVAGGRGHALLRLSPDGEAFYTTGAGATPDGGYPFLDRVDLRTGRAERLWQAQAPYHESVVAVLDDDAHRLVTRRESVDEPPNYFLRDRAAGTLAALTHFTDPAPQLAGIERRLITYEREDGITLSATLYTPAGYDAARDGPLPMLFWAYPRDYRDASAASQVTGSHHRFSRPSGLSPLFLLTQGYAVLDGPAMPIIGRDGAEPNDSYVEQLVASARAAVDAVVAMGIADRRRLAVGGHSYGAFMTANLLAHTDLFRAGIALSGAYNRTLTPFGFQTERRSYWDARDVYDRMSAFNYADRIRTPLLIVHGAADSNPGTQPLQSERLYQALAGHAAPARYVSLPYEGHNYVARQSVLHVLAEMVDWLDVHVQGR